MDFPFNCPRSPRITEEMRWGIQFPGVDRQRSMFLAIYVDSDTKTQENRSEI
jgi:hypothetical protein